MWFEDHFGSGSQRNERVKLAASFWNNVGAGMVIGGLAAAFFLDKPSGTWTKIAIAIAGLVLGWLCYSIASNMLTYLHTSPEDPRRALHGNAEKQPFESRSRLGWLPRQRAYALRRLRGDDGAADRVGEAGLAS
jgi:hypothetical protein